MEPRNCDAGSGRVDNYKNETLRTQRRMVSTVQEQSLLAPSAGASGRLLMIDASARNSFLSHNQRSVETRGDDGDVSRYEPCSLCPSLDVAIICSSLDVFKVGAGWFRYLT